MNTSFTHTFLFNIFSLFLIGGAVYLNPCFSKALGSQLSIPETGSKLLCLKDHDKESVFAMSLDALLDIKVITASKIPESQAKTASSISIITSEDLRRTGAQTIYDALGSLPGISVYYNRRNIPVIEIRGVLKDSAADDILFMLNGVALNGFPEIPLFDLPVANIERIEVVRGPGSSLYGTTAVIGVVNIITKDFKEVDGLDFSFNTQFEDQGSIGERYNLLMGKHFNGGGGFTLNLGIFNFDGAKQFVKADALGQRGFGDTSHKALDLQGSLKFGNLKLFSRYHKYNRGVFLGVIDVLSPDSEEKGEHFLLNGQIDFNPAELTSIILTGYVDHRNADWYLELFPAGSIPPPPHPLAPWNNSGYISKLDWTSMKAGGDLMVVYKGLKPHSIIAGIAGEYQDEHDIKHMANHNPGFLPYFENVSDLFGWEKPEARNLMACYIQDIWEPTDHIRGTFGARYDYYSDFGGTFNPRISLSWDFIKNYNLRLLYGTAFRAPNFGDQFRRDISGKKKDTDADPEEVKTFEASLGLRFTKTFNCRIIYFHNELDDLITIPAEEETPQDFNSAKVDGIEVEARYDFTEGSFFTANYTYTDSNLENGRSFPDVPSHKGNASFSWSIIEYLSLNLNLYWQEKTPRSSSDKRKAKPGYTVVNATLLASGFFRKMDIEFSIYNLFDRNYSYPAPAGSIHDDYSAPGISFLFGAKYGF